MSLQPTALTIGTFDGVHLGHQELVRRCTMRGRCVVLAFDPHPMTRLRPEAAPARLVTWERKQQLLQECGAAEVVRLEPSDELLSKPGDAFLAWVWERFSPELVVEGADFHYGKSRDGTVATLERFAAARGARVEVVRAVDVALGDHTIARASSSLVRWLVQHGRVADAQRVLGKAYELEGTVVQGDRKGRTIGVPTCNLSTPCLLPLDGVYAGRATLPTGSESPAVVAVGARPTVGGLQRRAEVHVLRNDTQVARGAWAPLPGVAEYGWHLRVQLHAFVRDEVRFPTWHHLEGQIRRDLSRVRALVAEG